MDYIDLFGNNGVDPLNINLGTPAAVPQKEFSMTDTSFLPPVASSPTEVTSTGKTTKPAGGMSPDFTNPWIMASGLSGLAAAFAPEVYNKRGQRVPTWQEKLAAQVNQWSRAQQMAAALAAPQASGTGQINPMLLALMLGGGFGGGK